MPDLTQIDDLSDDLGMTQGRKPFEIGSTLETETGVGVKTRQAKGPRSSKSPVPTLKQRIPASLALVLEWASKIAAWLFVITLVYLAYAVFSGSVAWFGWSQLNHPANHAERIPTLTNIRGAGAILAITGIYLALYTLFSAYELRDRFGALIIIFLLFQFGVPFVFINLMNPPLYPDSQYNEAAEEIVHYLQVVSIACLVACTVRAITAIYEMMRRGIGSVSKAGGFGTAKPTDRNKQGKKSSYRLLGRCWELGYCREYLLPVCTAWQKKKTCWKHGSGCFCDPSMVDRLIQVDMGVVARKTGNLPMDRSVPKGPNKCHSCMIYLSHEEQKYQVLSPLLPIVVLLSIVLGWDWVLEHYSLFANWVGNTVAHFALGPATNILANEWRITFLDPVVEYFAIGIGVLILISFLLKGLEWLVYDLKW